MAQNFLYMFEFVVDDLLITHPNECAPEEYPTCVELTFRSSVFLQICDRDFGGCIDIRNISKNGKCCLFGLDNSVSDKDKLHVHVYKKKLEKCKFLLGTTEISIKSIFDRVTSDFIQNNPILDKKNNNEPKQEEYCPSSEIEKKLLSLFNLDGRQTGNMVLIIRLSCMGPTIVSPFPFAKGCGRATSGGETCKSSPNRVRARGGENEISSSNKLIKQDYKKNNETQKYCNYDSTDESIDYSKDEFLPRQRAGVDSNESSENDDDFREQRKSGGAGCHSYKDNEYDEFEADMNGSGLSIRVLKDAFQVNVQDSDYESENDCKKHRYCGNDTEFQQSKFLNNQLRSQTGGSFINRPGLPKIRGTIKYAANELCPENRNFELPMPVTRKCGGDNNINKYRKRCPVNRCCCIQVQPDDIDETLTNINRKTKKDGIEICRKKCIDEDGDVFLFKLGKKKKCANKRQLIEIELRTPKVPTVLQKQLISQHTQIDEIELDSELKNICLKKKSEKKGKKK